MNEKTIAIIFENLIEAVIYSITINDLIRITTPQYFAGTAEERLNQYLEIEKDTIKPLAPHNLDYFHYC